MAATKIHPDTVPTICTVHTSSFDLRLLRGLVRLYNAVQADGNSRHDAYFAADTPLAIPCFTLLGNDSPASIECGANRYSACQVEHRPLIVLIFMYDAKILIHV